MAKCFIFLCCFSLVQSFFLTGLRALFKPASHVKARWPSIEGMLLFKAGDPLMGMGGGGRAGCEDGFGQSPFLKKILIFFLDLYLRSSLGSRPWVGGCQFEPLLFFGRTVPRINST